MSVATRTASRAVEEEGDASGSPEGGGRPARRRWISLGLFVTFVLVHLPVRSRFLVNWDAVNFALGIDAFNLSHHQPHPPGYVGYVGLGRVLAWFTGDANEALTLLSALAGGALVAVFYLLARRMLSEPFALLGALLLGTSPLVWYYSSVALTYVVGAAVATAVVWAAHHAHRGSGRRYLYGAAVLLGLLGAIRQTDLVLLLPVVALVAVRYPWGTRLRAAGLLGAISAGWLVPLVASSGGIDRYLELSRQLAELAGGRTFVLSGDLTGFLQNVGLVGLGILLGLSATLLLVIAARRRGTWRLERLGAADRRLIITWLTPPLLVFVLVHTGQFGYVLLILPPLMLAAASIGEEAWESAGGLLGTLSPRRSAGPLAALAVVLLGVNLAVSTRVPTAAVDALRDQASEEALEPVLPGGGGVVERTRQYVLADNDTHWRQLVRWIRRFPPRRTVVLATPNSGGSFRHLSYYTPRYRILAVGDDRDGTFGYLFSAHRGQSRYSIEGLEEARRVLRLPSSVRWVVVPDRAVQAHLPDGAPHRRLRLGDGTRVVALRVPTGSTLWFDADEYVRIRKPRGEGAQTT